MRKALTNLQKRHYRVRSRVSGTALRPRLSVYKSNKNMFAQLIDDEKSISLAGCSTRYALEKKASKTEAAGELGKKIAELAKAKGITEVVFDRGGYKYHGRVKTLADSAREAGLVF